MFSIDVGLGEHFIYVLRVALGDLHPSLCSLLIRPRSFRGWRTSAGILLGLFLVQVLSPGMCVGRVVLYLITLIENFCANGMADNIPRWSTCLVSSNTKTTTTTTPTHLFQIDVFDFWQKILVSLVEKKNRFDESQKISFYSFTSTLLSFSLASRSACLRD